MDAVNDAIFYAQVKVVERILEGMESAGFGEEWARAQFEEHMGRLLLGQADLARRRTTCQEEYSTVTNQSASGDDTTSRTSSIIWHESPLKNPNKKHEGSAQLTWTNTSSPQSPHQHRQPKKRLRPQLGSASITKTRTWSESWEMELESFGVNLKHGSSIMVNERRVDFEETFHGVFRLVQEFYLGESLPRKRGRSDPGKTSTSSSTSSFASSSAFATVSAAHSDSLLFLSHGYASRLTVAETRRIFLELDAMVRSAYDCEMLVCLFTMISACCSWESEASIDALCSGLLVDDDVIQHSAFVLLERIERVPECKRWVDAMNPFLGIAFVRMKEELEDRR